LRKIGDCVDNCANTLLIRTRSTVNNHFLSRTLVAVTLAAFMLSLAPYQARAGIISTADGIASRTALARSANLAKVQAQLARVEVQQQLTSYGVQPAQVQERVAALTDEEIASLAMRMDQAPAGADVGLFGLLGVVFIVLLVLDYVGAIHIFSHRR
jgi:hypothetical protein